MLSQEQKLVWIRTSLLDSRQNSWCPTPKRDEQRNKDKKGLFNPHVRWSMVLKSFRMKCFIVKWDAVLAHSCLHYELTFARLEHPRLGRRPDTITAQNCDLCKPANALCDRVAMGAGYTLRDKSTCRLGSFQPARMNGVPWSFAILHYGWISQIRPSKLNWYVMQIVLLDT